MKVRKGLVKKHLGNYLNRLMRERYTLISEGMSTVESAFHRSWGKWRQGDSTQTDSLIFDSREYLITVKVR